MTDDDVTNGLRALRRLYPVPVAGERMADSIQAKIDELQNLVDGFEEWGADVRRLTRAIDVALHGEEGAAKQASLCDLVGPARDLASDRDRLLKDNKWAGREMMRLQTGIDDLRGKNEWAGTVLDQSRKRVDDLLEEHEKIKATVEEIWIDDRDRWIDRFGREKARADLAEQELSKATTQAQWEHNQAESLKDDLGHAQSVVDFLCSSGWTIERDVNTGYWYAIGEASSLGPFLGRGNAIGAAMAHGDKSPAGEA